mmetsp:Transcript_76396/g.218872  ORF Transcript_76396/g.218872 Transcript_76396/m.218872 type:complete len:567 (-) Transcript_76396:138-1838(-)
MPSGRAAAPPEGAAESKTEDDSWKDVYTQDEIDEGDHEWHWRYNRRLSCFSHAVCSLAFSQDGQYLVSGTGSGDVKVWDTGCWAEAGKLKGCRREEPRVLVISPAQRWLVAAYSKVLHIFHCRPPWKLEQSLPAMLDPCTGELSEWACCAFSPMAEVDHPAGNAGQDNHLAVFSNSVLCVVDYSGGWGEDAPRRTRSLMQSGRPTMLVYTACGSFMICGFESGMLQIWNTASLTHVKTLSAHTECVNGLASSPKDALYPPRFVSCGVDQTLRVWHSQGWILEQHVHETRCDRNGLRKCVFSADGNWLLSVANQLCVWRVNISQRGRLILTLHQRLAAVCGAEGLRTAAFSNQDAIAVGSRDGVLGLWIKYPGMPPDPAEESPPSSPQKANIRTETWVADRFSFARPMQKVTTGGIRPQQQRLAGSDWMRTARRPMPLSAARSVLSSSGGLVCNSPLGSSSSSSAAASAAATVASANPIAARAIVRTATMPDLTRFRQNRNADTVLSNLGMETTTRHTVSAADADYAEMDSPVRKSIQHACRRGLVQRITLDAKVITDQHFDQEAAS